MDALKMLEQYKNDGSRVDEVLFHTVAKELGRLREIIDQKNFSIDLIGEQKLDAQKENKHLREGLESVQNQLFSIRGINKVHDSEITELCAGIRRTLEGVNKCV
ncbi:MULTISPECIES: hypothetical protein [unclassified Lysinibacillus]|uniref:hypothetical protein n=1 Tax=unclassified Lysinibacillus TaxID=2636778 RepID=UPI003829108E